MPYKSEKMVIAGTKHDRRIKLTEEQKREIKSLYAEGTIGCLALAKKFGVSKRLIQFVIHPEKLDKSKERLKEAKRNGLYKPDKKAWAETMREHRKYKQQLYLDGEIG